MKTLVRTKFYSASPSEVFKTIDDLGVTGMHMTESSMMMMGSKLHLTFLTQNKTGLNSKYRWTGKMLGIPMDFTVAVTKWIVGTEKVWETIGPAKLIIYSWYQMALHVEATPNGSAAELSITYKRPAGFISKILSFLFADVYCIWCLNTMLNDAEKAIQTHPHRGVAASSH